MSPEDEARARLLAHYERLAGETALRAERLGRTLLSTYDQAEAEFLRSRIEQLRASSQDVKLKADNVRELIDRVNGSSG
jgi:hypothetical protein